MQVEFEMSMMGELNLFIGLRAKQLKHETYCKDLLKKFDMNKCKETITPILTSWYLNLDEKEVVVDQTKYIGLLGSLLYLTTSIPDIMFSVCLCARYQTNSSCKLDRKALVEHVIFLDPI